MSVAFDAVATATVAAGNSTTLSWTHTPVGTPTAVGVFLMNYEAGLTVTGVTYGGVAMTLKQSQTVIYSGGNSTLQIWGLASPPSGAQSVVVTGTIVAANIVYIDAASMTVTGGDTNTAFRTSNSAVTTTTGATTISTTLASAVSGDLVADIVGFNYSVGGETVTPGGSQTKKWGNLMVGGNMAAGSIQAAAGSTTMSWTISASVPSGLSLAVAAAAFLSVPAVITPVGIQGFVISEW
jgi:hypothetical protein